MFELLKALNPAQTHGRYKSLILVSEETPPNANLNYETGYLDIEGKFIPTGNNTLFLRDIEETINEDKTVIPAKFVYSEFMLQARDVLNTADSATRLQMMEDFIKTKIGG